MIYKLDYFDPAGPELRITKSDLKLKINLFHQSDEKMDKIV